MSEALKACPFCGGEAAKVKKAARPGIVGKATCWNDDCPLKHTYLTEAAWNRRAPSDREKALVEAVRAWAEVTPDGEARSVVAVLAALRRYEEEL